MSLTVGPSSPATVELFPPVEGETYTSQLFSARQQKSREDMARILPELMVVLAHGSVESRREHAFLLTDVAEALSNQDKKPGELVPSNPETFFSINRGDFQLAHRVFAFVGESFTKPVSPSWLPWKRPSWLLSPQNVPDVADPAFHARVIKGFAETTHALAKKLPQEELSGDLLVTAVQFIAALHKAGFSPKDVHADILALQVGLITEALTSRDPKLVAETLSERIFKANDKIESVSEKAGRYLSWRWGEAVIAFGKQGGYADSQVFANAPPETAAIKPNLIQALSLAARTVGVKADYARDAAHTAFDRLIEHHVFTSPDPLQLAPFGDSLGISGAKFREEHFEAKLRSSDTINKIRMAATLEREVTSARAIEASVRKLAQAGAACG